MEFYVNLNFSKEVRFLEIFSLFPAGFGSNCYILVSDNSAAVIDPSVSAKKIADFVSQKGATIEKIILTHGHFDHVDALDELRDLTKAPALIHKNDGEMLEDGMKNAYSLFYGQDKKWRSAEILLENGDKINLGNETVEVISTPGHSKGSICLLGDGLMITGDTLFANGYGRYDLYGGDADELESSLARLRKFDKDLTIYPGHGGTAKLGQALDNVLYY